MTLVNDIWRVGSALGVVVLLGACGGGGGAAVETATRKLNLPLVVIQTDKGEVEFELNTPVAPNTVATISGLILTGTYDNQTFYAGKSEQYLVLGDSDTVASAVSELSLEISGEPLDRGSVALGWSGSSNHPTHRLIFPLTRLDRTLDNHFSVFGRVLSGLDVLDSIAVGDQVLRISTRLTAPIVRLVTERGSIVISMLPDWAPTSVARVSDLTCQGFYNGLSFHRVVFELIQTGDPTGEGDGGSGVSLPAEFNNLRFLRTAVGMARLPDDPDSADSQFFILKTQVPSLDGAYALFGEVAGGMEVVDRIQLGDIVLEATLQFDLEGRDCAASDGNSGNSGGGPGGPVTIGL